MCGRYSLTKLEQILRQFPFVKVLPQGEARHNIAPTQPVLAITNHHADRADFLHWGLVPSWAKGPEIGRRLINARAETLAEKPAFRTSLRRRRCLVPADGFYEWRREPDGTKTPMHIHLKSGGLFAFAGLWDVWHSADGSELTSCTLITGTPNEVVKPIHDRMVVIVPPERYQEWLAPEERAPDELAPLLTPYPASEMEAYPVSTQSLSIRAKPGGTPHAPIDLFHPIE